MSQPEDPDQIRQGPSLSADGSLEGRLERVESARPPPPEALELAERAPRVVEARAETFRAPVPEGASRRKRALQVVVLLLLLGVAALAALLILKPKLDALVPPDGVREATLLDALIAGGEAPPLLINSTPPGATILIGGQQVGQTPWAGDNRWRGETRLILRLKGFPDWQGTLAGGKAQTLDVQLKK